MISGSGTNLQALIDANVPVAGVVSNRKAAYGLKRAANAGIPTLYFSLKPYNDEGKSRTAYDADLAAAIKEQFQPDLIVLAGWMHVLSSAFLDQFPQRVINLHPALPGAFAGKEAIGRAYAAFQNDEIEETGCMVHYVVPEVDAGPVIAQAVVPILESDTLTDLKARIHEAEHQLIVQATHLVLSQT